MECASQRGKVTLKKLEFYLRYQQTNMETKKMQITKDLTRRKFFASTGAAALSIGSASIATTASAKVKYDQADSSMKFEVMRSEEEWQEILTQNEYAILRKGLTERPRTSPLWKETAAGTYHCKGCDLPAYTSNQKVILDKGWVFFYHSEPDSVMMSIDGNVPSEYGEMGANSAAVVEVHCRRCASHLGHFLVINKAMTHCINGTALTFKPTAV